MNSVPQRWLSLTGICNTLNLTPGDIKRLYKQKLLVRLWKNGTAARYLDPTPEYAERLRLAAVMLSKKPAVSIDLPMTFLLTIREIAEIMGWTQRKTTRFVEEHKIPCWKSKNRARLFSVSVVRDMIFKRQGRHLAKQKAPMLLAEMIDFFRRFQANEEAIVPTDAAFKEDEALQKKIAWMMRQKSPEREIMLADFMEKVDLAKRAVSALRSPSA